MPELELLVMLILLWLLLILKQVKILQKKFKKGEEQANYGEQILQQVAVVTLQNLEKDFRYKILGALYENFYLVYSKSQQVEEIGCVFKITQNELRISDNENITIKNVASKYQTILPSKTEWQKTLNHYD